MPVDDIVNEWLDRAHDDEKSIIAILKEHGGASNTACFLAQQMAEKLLKSLFAFYKRLPPKIHDLKRLATEIEAFLPEIAELENVLSVLNKYYVITRYPGDFPEGFSWSDAKYALTTALKVKEFVLKKVAI